MGASQQGQGEVCLLMEREQENKQSFFGQFNLCQTVGPGSVSQSLHPNSITSHCTEAGKKKTQDSQYQSKQEWLVCFFPHF